MKKEEESEKEDAMNVESSTKSTSTTNENESNGASPAKKRAKSSPQKKAALAQKPKPPPPAVALELQKPKTPVASAPKAAAALSSSSSSSGADGEMDFSKGGDIVTEKQAKMQILSYLRHQNRPYSAIQIFENLHKRAMKSLVERALDSLVKAEDGPILIKEYKTNKIYWPKQKGMKTASTSELKDLDNELKAKKQELDDLDKFYSQLSKQLQTRLQEPTDEYLDAVLAEQEKKVAAMQTKADKLASNKIDPQALNKTIQKHNFYRSKWVELKNGVMDVVNNIAEGMEKKPSVIMADLGIETDADVDAIVPKALVAPK